MVCASAGLLPLWRSRAFSKFTRLAGETTQLRSVRPIPFRSLLLAFANLQALRTSIRISAPLHSLTKCRLAAKHRLLSCCARVGSLELILSPCILTSVGTDQSQGRGQVLSNINACLAVQSTIKGTLGPYGGDLLMVDANGRQTITNDGATVMKVILLGTPDRDFKTLTLYSSSTSSTLLPAFSLISHDRKTPKLVMAQHPLL